MENRNNFSSSSSSFTRSGDEGTIKNQPHVEKLDSNGHYKTF